MRPSFGTVTTPIPDGVPGSQSRGSERFLRLRPRTKKIQSRLSFYDPQLFVHDLQPNCTLVSEIRNHEFSVLNFLFWSISKNGPTAIPNQ